MKSIEFEFRWRDLRYGVKDWTKIDAEDFEEALGKFADFIGGTGVGTANCLVIAVSSDKATYQVSGRLDKILRELYEKDEIDVEDATCTKDDDEKPVYHRGFKIVREKEKYDIYLGKDVWDVGYDSVEDAVEAIDKYKEYELRSKHEGSR